MWRAGRLNIHSERHMLLLLHLSTSGISVAAACAETAICTDKSLITRHKQQCDPPLSTSDRTDTHTAIHSLSVCACRPALNQTFLRGTIHHHTYQNTWSASASLSPSVRLPPIRSPKPKHSADFHRSHSHFAWLPFGWWLCLWRLSALDENGVGV